VTREKARIYTLGSADVRSFSRNKRGIAGSLIWVNFDRHALLSLVHKLGSTYVANVDDIHPQFVTDDKVYLSQNSIFNATLVRDNGLHVTSTIDALSGQRLDTVSGFKEWALPSYCDQILPFDITVAVLRK
jgi:hypothetical protein